MSAKKAAKKKVARNRARTGGAKQRRKKSNDDPTALLKAAEAAANAAGDEDATPPTEEELQEILDAGTLGTYIDGHPSVCGTILRPITASCMAILKEISSGLVAGLKINEIDNMALHGAKFVVLWRDDCEGDADEEDLKRQLRESRRLMRHPDELEDLAYEWLDTIPPNQIAQITNESIFALRDALSNQVEPIPKDGENDDDDEGVDEVEGND